MTQDSGLLVSVRNADEADIALAGGASLIDVKEPALGALGKADDGVINGVLARVNGRLPVSAAFGELIEWPRTSSLAAPACLSFIKVGLAGLAAAGNWYARFRDLGRAIGPRLVMAAYADWQDAHAPALEDVIEFAISEEHPAVLIDTFAKNGRTLLDFEPVQHWAALVGRLRSLGISCALAGSLGSWQIKQLSGVRPAWFAVRGAVCRGGRLGTMETKRVRQLVDAISYAEAGHELSRGN